MNVLGIFENYDGIFWRTVSWLSSLFISGCARIRSRILSLVLSYFDELTMGLLKNEEPRATL